MYTLNNNKKNNTNILFKDLPRCSIFVIPDDKENLIHIKAENFADYNDSSSYNAIKLYDNGINFYIYDDNLIVKPIKRIANIDMEF